MNRRLLIFLLHSTFIIHHSAFVAHAQATRPAPLTLADKTFLTLPGDQWHLLWHDEFDGPALDTGKWTILLSWKGDDGTQRHHSRDYASYIADDNVIFADGMLNLLTKRQDTTIPSGITYHFTEGLIQTSGKFDYTYGYCETRLKAPKDDGPGLWPAFWMLSRGWPPEDDVAEFWSGRPEPHTHQGFAFRDHDGRVQWQSIHKNQIDPGFHTFGMEWGPGYQIFNRDDKVTLTVYGPHVPSVPMYMILNSGVASRPGPTTQTTFPNAFVVDYLRIYSRPPLMAAHNLDFETGELRPWIAPKDRAKIVDSHAHTGRYALRLTGPNTTAQQTIFGLRPNTGYQVTAWIDAAASKVTLGVKAFSGSDDMGEEVSKSATGWGYQQLSVTFTTGAMANTATVYCSVLSDSGEAFLDDVTVEAVPPKVAVPATR